MPQPYAHLLPVDVAVWDRFLAKFGAEYDLLEYDIRVGLGRDPGDDYPENIRNMALDLSYRRIDCVAHSKGLITVIEITHSAGFKALGQIYGYPILYTLTYLPVWPVRAMLVAGEIQSDIENVLLSLGIRYEVV